MTSPEIAFATIHSPSGDRSIPRNWPIFSVAAEGWLLAQSGQTDAAIDRLRKGVSDARTSGAPCFMSLLLGALAEAELASGRVAEGLAALDDATAFVGKTRERFWEAEIHRLRGEALRLGGDEDSAEATFRQGLEIARNQGARFLELRGATSLAKLWNDPGRATEVRRLLSDALDGFTEGYDTADYLDAKALLAMR